MDYLVSLVNLKLTFTLLCKQTVFKENSLIPIYTACPFISVPYST